MDLIFGYLAGLLTVINPCILPVLPVVLIAALNEHRYGVIALCFGLTIAFVSAGTVVSALGPALGIDDQTISAAASLAMILFGLILLIPALSSRFAVAAGGASNTLSAKMGAGAPTGLRGQFVTGLLLGAVWSPCIGPTLGGAIALAAEGNNILWAMLIMFAFALGVCTLILTLAMLSREALFRSRERLQNLSPIIRPLTGILLVALGLFLWFGLNHPIESWLLDTLPYWLTDLSVSI